MKIDHRPKPVRFAGFTLIIATLLLSPAALLAQSQESQKPAPEVQQLRARLQQLEETVEQLKTQINSMEDSQKPSGAAVGARIAAPAPEPVVAPKSADTAG